MKILDLARDLILLSGLSPDDLEITIVGPRPGEKLVEEILYNEEETLPSRHPKLRMTYHRPYSPEEVHARITELLSLVDQPESVIRQRLKQVVDDHGLISVSHKSDTVRVSHGDVHHFTVAAERQHGVLDAQRRRNPRQNVRIDVRQLVVLRTGQAVLCAQRVRYVVQPRRLNLDQGRTDANAGGHVPVQGLAEGRGINDTGPA